MLLKSRSITTVKATDSALDQSKRAASRDRAGLTPSYLQSTSSPMLATGSPDLLSRHMSESVLFQVVRLCGATQARVITVLSVISGAAFT